MSGFLLLSSPQTSSASFFTRPSSHLTLQQLSSRLDPAFSSSLLLHSNLSLFTSASISHQAFSQSSPHFPELLSSSTASLAVAIISHATPPVTDMNEDTTRNTLQNNLTWRIRRHGVSKCARPELVRSSKKCTIVLSKS